MDNQNITGVDMNEELYVGPRGKLEFIPAPKAEQEYLEMLKGTDPALQLTALRMLVHSARARTVQAGGKYTKELVDSLVGIFKKCAVTPFLQNRSAWELGAEGGNCEQVGDYQGAAWFYEAALGFETKDPKLSFYRLNNLGFCLNYLRRFAEAEVQLLAAIELQPKLYNAHKNLGVTLEHQGKTEEAAQSYMRAINFSGAEARSVKHLLRLIARNPVLSGIPEVIAYLDSLVQAGVIPKPGQA